VAERAIAKARPWRIADLALRYMLVTDVSKRRQEILQAVSRKAEVIGFVNFI